MSSVTDLLGRLRELAVQGANGTLAEGDRKAITAELRARYEELIGIANSRDGSGRYVFSGYMGDTVPFSGNVEAGVSYAGDSGQRRLQLAPTRFLEISDSGYDVFQNIRNGNGYFATGLGTYTGTAIIDGGSVTNPVAWNANVPTSGLKIQFWQDSTGTRNVPVGSMPGKTFYEIVDAAGDSVFTGIPPDPLNPFSFTHEYQEGVAIPLVGQGNVDLGAHVLVSGSPATGDEFTINPSTSQSLFATLGNLITDLESPAGSTSDKAKLANNVGFALTNLSQAEENILRVRAQIGTRMNEVDSLSSMTQDLNIQYQQTLSDLQDLDYAKTLSDLTRKQTDLEAAQKSFVAISKLSLFNYI
jgi:flagellar hook-associated protein 3 FlgL